MDHQQEEARAQASRKVNMRNCYKQCQHLFSMCKDGMIHYNVLISYWMIAGDLGLVYSVDDAYKKGCRFLGDLIRDGTLKHSAKDFEMIQPVKAIQICRHEGSCEAEHTGFPDLFQLDRIENVVLIDGILKKIKASADSNYLSKQVFESRRGLKYLAHFNPTPNSIRPLLEDIKSPSVLMLRGCDDHFFRIFDFTSPKFETLTVLEISGSGLFTNVPIQDSVSKLTQLRCLCLSDPLILELPKDLFSHLRELRWLVLRGCSRLDIDPSILKILDKLELLDLSSTSMTTFPSLALRLTHMYLRDTKIDEFCFFRNHSYVLNVLDLSRTEIRYVGYLRVTTLTHLIFRECPNLHGVLIMKELTNLEVLDVSGCRNLVELPENLGNLRSMKELNLSGCCSLESLREGLFDEMTRLVKLDLSATNIKLLPSFANLTSLRKLSLRGLELDSQDYFETWTTSLSNLVELDLQGLKIISSVSLELKLDFLVSLGKLQILNLSKTSVEELPDMSMLGSLKELLLSDCRKLKVVPDIQPLTSLVTLDLSLSDDTFVNEIQWKAPLSASLRKLVLKNRVELRKLFDESEFLDLGGTDEIDSVGERMISNSNAVQIHVVYDADNQLSVFDQFIYEFAKVDALISDIQKNSNRSFERRFEMLRADLKYIQENLNRLQNSHNRASSEELLQELLYVASNLSFADFQEGSSNLNQLFRVVVKLKVLFPPTTNKDVQKASTTTKQKKKVLFTKVTSKRNSDGSDINIDEFDILHSSYTSLTDTEKNCLLCFSAFPCDKQDEGLLIKKRILIYWWVGEGFFGPIDSPATQQTIEDIGEQILKVLTDKGFIESVIKKSRETGIFRMRYSVHSFVTAQAKIEGFFDSWLAPFITRRSNNSLTLLTLFNVNESLINIKPEWLSKMDQLSVLYLGNRRCSENAKHIEIMEPELLLEDLNKLKKLRLCSLQGLPTIKKLPNSICKLINLIVLDLRECSYLEELPSGIGSLKNLTHLDLTNCTLLTKLPKGISLLSKLQVLKGFVIPDDRNECLKTTRCSNLGYKNVDEACFLGDLSEMYKLRKLSVVVNMTGFPYDEHLKVLRGMRNLRKLKILWERNYDVGPALTRQDELDDTDYYYYYTWLRLGNIEKLELWCYPNELSPGWIDPLISTKLEKLYIVGGNLREFRWSSNSFNVKTLRLKYLPNLKDNQSVLMDKFRHLTYVEVHQCEKLIFAPYGEDGPAEFDEEGVWRPSPGRKFRRF